VVRELARSEGMEFVVKERGAIQPGTVCYRQKKNGTLYVTACLQCRIF